VALDVSTEERDDLVLLSLAGELDIYNVASFRSEVERYDIQTQRIVVDLTDVTLLDSSGLGALVSMLNQAKAGSGQLGLICPHRRLRRVFEITGLRKAFTFGDDLDGVREALDAGPDAPG
jgi:anti-sigma B factor antagonist